MRTFALIVCLTVAFGCSRATAESDRGKADAATVGTARTPPEDKGQLQPQGWTGPVNTQSGGAPAESPQGQSPPGMQAAPDGSDKTVVAPEK